MAIYAISDLHLSYASPKPMDIFGPAWKDHADKIRKNWDAVVKETDTVLIPGDLSWAMRIEDAAPDLEYLAQRPGKKIITRGNHDYWWRRKSTSRIQKTIDTSITLLQGTSAVVDTVGITGTRGWRIENMKEEPAERLPSEKILKRELAYLESGLRSIPHEVKTKITMLHYPPFNENMRPNEFARMLASHKVDILVYGHIHTGKSDCITGQIEGVEYRAVSADVLDFTPALII